ncbi:WH1 domain-containing protein [Ditylenchus destructor]|uniref:WH1 domain-containing protein n=1 Tax=Ditylenchus destructor TaxID=166010 RepID=A0AAD4NEP5_9BILA|nr:WH1 domain-containing protein [Ditylenchus destructor]
MRDETMSGASGESLLACATADVMIYEESTKLWVRPDDAAGPANSGIPTGQKLSNVQLIQDNNAKSVGFRIVAIRIHDRKVLINQNIYAKLKYHAATNSFHQWRNEHRQVFGLSFTMEQEATKFFGVVQQVMEWHGNAQTNAIQAANDDYGTHQHTQHHQQHYANGNGEVNNGVNNSVYQDPQYYQFQQQQPQMSSGNQFHQHNHYAETDQSAMASSNGHTPASHAYR